MFGNVEDQMTRVFENKSDLLGAVGEMLGSSEWVEVTREMVHQFADATGDHQWIHVDDERARRESPSVVRLPTGI
ncbi:hypothetical protein GCM10020255_107650 [Rhodococcus baikonurensis]